MKYKISRFSLLALTFSSPIAFAISCSADNNDSESGNVDAIDQVKLKATSEFMSTDLNKIKEEFIAELEKHTNDKYENALTALSKYFIFTKGKSLSFPHRYGFAAGFYSYSNESKQVDLPSHETLNNPSKVIITAPTFILVVKLEHLSRRKDSQGNPIVDRVDNYKYIELKQIKA